MKKMILEQKDLDFDNTKKLINFTPPIDEDFFLFKVKLFKNQAILGFPKFGTIGIGFAQKKDWNTNLPYTCEAEEIYNHIKHNKKYKNIKKSDCINAIKIIQKASFNYLKK